MVSLKCETWLLNLLHYFVTLLQVVFVPDLSISFNYCHLKMGFPDTSQRTWKQNNSLVCETRYWCFLKKKKKKCHLSAAFSFPRKKIMRIPVPFLSSILASLGAVIFIVLGFWHFKMICLSASLFHPLRQSLTILFHY